LKSIRFLNRTTKGESVMETRLLSSEPILRAIVSFVLNVPMRNITPTTPLFAGLVSFMSLREISERAAHAFNISFAPDEPTTWTSFADAVASVDRARERKAEQKKKHGRAA
jgi:hypothetical protein